MSEYSSVFPETLQFNTLSYCCGKVYCNNSVDFPFGKSTFCLFDFSDLERFNCCFVLEFAVFDDLDYCRFDSVSVFVERNDSCRSREHACFCNSISYSNCVSCSPCSFHCIKGYQISVICKSCNGSRLDICTILCSVCFKESSCFFSQWNL